MGSNPAAAGGLAGGLAGGPADRLAGRGAAGMFAPAAVINAAHAATGAGPATHAKFCFWVRQRFACWRAKFPGRLTSDLPPTAISHCCGPAPRRGGKEKGSGRARVAPFATQATAWRFVDKDLGLPKGSVRDSRR